MEMAGFSADNVVFGSGGKLLQALDRDTMRFAMKASSIGIRENIPAPWNPDVVIPELVYRDVFKDPITDSGKTSKKGRVTLYKSGNDYVSGVEGVQPKNWTDKSDWEVALQEVFRDGELKNEITFDEVRANARK
jgi:nicotinamide phosphoribosyltransferase